MGRPVYPYELADPDFAWLLNHFQDTRPHYMAVQDVGLPVVMVEMSKGEKAHFEDFAPPVLAESEAQEIEPEPKG